MPLRILLIVGLSALLTVSVLYAATVQRGPIGMREELAWEVAASEYLPVRTRIFAEQRMPEYPRPLRWLAPAFADIHALDVRVRRAYWHEEVVPDVPPDFDLAE
jgi:hypothetical protein